MAGFRINFVSDSVKDAMDVYVIIPQKKRIRNAQEPEITPGSFDKEYPVLMLLHDEASSPGELLNMSRAERYANENQLMLVVPTGLLSFYTDYAERDCSSNEADKTSGNAGIENNFTEMCYETYIIDVLTYIQRIFPASAAREKIWIGGIGMGGFGALKLGMKYPQIFSKVFSISGDVDLQWKIEHEPWRREQFLSIFGEGALSGSNDLPQACLKMSKSGGALPQLLLLWNKNDGKDDMNQRLADVLDHTYPGFKAKRWEAPYGWDYIDDTISFAFRWASLD